MTFAERNNLARDSERLFCAELEARGWQHFKLRPTFPGWLNNALRDFRDSYFRPCHLRWMPDFIIARPGDPQSLRAADVKWSRSGRLEVESRALRVYCDWEQVHHCPVILAFYCPTGFPAYPEENIPRSPEWDDPASPLLGPQWLAIAAGKAELNALPRHSAHSECSSDTPYYSIDARNSSPLDRFLPLPSVVKAKKKRSGR